MDRVGTWLTTMAGAFRGGIPIPGDNLGPERRSEPTSVRGCSSCSRCCSTPSTSAGYRSSRFDAFQQPGFDLGIFDQGIWLLSRFKSPFVTIMGLNLFGDHASYILLLLRPAVLVCARRRSCCCCARPWHWPLRPSRVPSGARTSCATRGWRCSRRGLPAEPGARLAQHGELPPGQLRGPAAAVRSLLHDAAALAALPRHGLLAAAREGGRRLPGGPPRHIRRAAA